MFKGIYNVYSVDLQLSAVKIIPRMSKNRAHLSYLILKGKNFCRVIGIAAFRSRPWLDLQKPGGGMIFSNVRQELPGAQRLRGQNHYIASPKRNWYQITPETLIEKASL